MKIIKLRLYNYKRFPLLTDTSVTIEPCHKMIYILGTNGSGKSSLVKELSPLPPTPQDYNTQGSKYIEIEHNNHYYVLSSKITNTMKNSFIVDGVELNPSGTTQIQKDLCMSHFTMDNQIHELITGVRQFTEMSVAERRSWFTKLSNINIDFALTKFNEYKELLKDVESEIKIRTSMFHQEKSKLLEEEDILFLKTKIDQLNIQIKEGNELKESFLKGHNMPKTDPRDAVEVLNSRLRLFIKNNGKRLRIPLNELKEQWDERTKLHLNLQTRYNIANQEFLDLTKQLDQLQITKPTESEETLLETKKQLTAYIEGVQKTFQFIAEVTLDKEQIQNTLRLMYADIKVIQDDIIPHINQIPINKDRAVYNLNLRKKYNDQLDYINKELDNQKKQAFKHKNDIERLEELFNQGYISCPVCTHSWIRNYDSELHKALERELVQFTRNIETLELSKNEVMSSLTECDEYIRIHDTIKYLMSKTSDQTKTFWEVVLAKDFLYNDPKTIVTMFNNQYVKDFTNYKNLYTKLNELEKVEIELSKINMRNANQIEYLDALKREKEVVINKLTEEYNNSTRLKKELEDSIKLTEQFLDIKEQVIKLDNMLKLFADQSAINYVIEQLSLNAAQDTIKINEYITRIRQNDNIKSVAEEHQDAINKLEIKRYTLDVICKELSPKDGLIAKTLNQFIVAFVNNINGFIQAIWSYPMELMADIDDVNMDYRFKVKVNDDLIVQDISRGSKGMQEIINLAFRLTAMAYLKISHYPLFLDEFGTHLDTEHRRKAFDAITNLTYYSNHSQIFLISHHEHSYSGLSNADIILLNHDNIRLPDSVKYNAILTLS